MRNRLLGALLLMAILAICGCGGGGPRNCLVIPAQIEIVKERRDALLTELEGTARRVDRQAGTLAAAKARFDELLAQKALLDSLAAAGGDAGGAQTAPR
jgi:predicted small lipoprotein YifL